MRNMIWSLSSVLMGLSQTRYIFFASCTSSTRARQKQIYLDRDNRIMTLDSNQNLILVNWVHVQTAHRILRTLVLAGEDFIEPLLGTHDDRLCFVQNLIHTLAVRLSRALFLHSLTYSLLFSNSLAFCKIF